MQMTIELIYFKLKNVPFAGQDMEEKKADPEHNSSRNISSSHD